MDIPIIALAVLFLISGGRLYFAKDFGDKLLAAIEIFAVITVFVTTQV